MLQPAVASRVLALLGVGSAGSSSGAAAVTAAGRTLCSSSSSSSSSNSIGSSSGASPPAATSSGPAILPTARRRPVVAVAMSGGVDSAVAALLLRRAGYETFGVFMRNWDAGDEAGGGGNGVCTSERDLTDAQEVCRRLQIPLLEADFVGRYWGDVFTGFLAGVTAGVTPNPDLTCNAAIKFGALWDFAAAAGADALATGHYARLGRRRRVAAAAAGGGGRGNGSGYIIQPLGPFETWSGPAAAAADSSGGGSKEEEEEEEEVEGTGPLLLRGADPSKDQSYFLASVGAHQLARAMFPVGHMLKSEVRAIAATERLRPAAKRSSAGICFIGRRPFGEFIEGYVPPAPGRFVCADTGTDLGACRNLLALTPGQRAPLGGGAERRYIVGKDLSAGVAWVAEGHDHPALLSSSALLLPARWVAGAPPAPLVNDSSSGGRGGGDGSSGESGWAAPGLACSCKARYRQPDAACVVQAPAAGAAARLWAGADGGQPSSSPGGSSSGARTRLPDFKPSRFGGASSIESAYEAAHAAAAAAGPAAAAGDGPPLLLTLPRPLRGLAPGQAVVFYQGGVVLGSAQLAAAGETEAERLAATGSSIGTGSGACAGAAEDLRPPAAAAAAAGA